MAVLLLVGKLLVFEPFLPAIIAERLQVIEFDPRIAPNTTGWLAVEQYEMPP